jgi:hypothetical protein
MERTVPSTGSEEIELFQRTYYSLLRSTADVQIRTLEEAHAGMKSLMHPAAREGTPDMSAFIYSLLRLPPCIHQVQLVVLGQNPMVFSKAGFNGVESWTPVNAIARRRRCFFDGGQTLACFIASVSDIDDVIPILTAYQIEWNKLHFLLQDNPVINSNNSQEPESLTSVVNELTGLMGLRSDDVERLMTVWGNDFTANLRRIASTTSRLRVKLLSGSLVEYRRATDIWWERISQACTEIISRPVYFISSNPHSLVNILSGYAMNKHKLVGYLMKLTTELKNEWENIQAQQVVSSQKIFILYLEEISAIQNRLFFLANTQAENDCGIVRVSSEHSFDVDAQIIELNQICPDTLDPRLCNGEMSFMTDSDAILINIDYPLGMAAYTILSEISEHLERILGIYIMGKSASLNGTVGDVIIPNVVHDEHSRTPVSNCLQHPISHRI